MRLFIWPDSSYTAIPLYRVLPLDDLGRSVRRAKERDEVTRCLLWRECGYFVVILNQPQVSSFLDRYLGLIYLQVKTVSLAQQLR